MRTKIRYRLWAGAGLLGFLLLGVAAGAQQLPREDPANPPAIDKVQTTVNPTQPCVQPPPPVSWKDYVGPFHKTLAIFARKIERESVGPPSGPNYKPNTLICSLKIKDKFKLFVRESVDPVTFLQAGSIAGLSQAMDSDPTFGQGAGGYVKRFGANYVDQVQFRFFKEFAYPTVFSEDPRYYRLGRGGKGKRVLHAMTHSVVAFQDNGHRMFNFSELLGNSTGEMLANLYHPGNDRGFSATASHVGFDFAIDSGFDVIREFWPELAQALHLPFRDQNDAQNEAQDPVRP